MGALAGLISINAATLGPAAASAWDLPPPPQDLAKTASLLGGESALLRTWVAQGIVATPITTTASVPAPHWAPSPASLWSVASVPRETRGDPSEHASGGPDVFGSVAVPIGSTPYDAMWRRASGTSARGLSAWTTAFTPVRNGDSLRLLREVNGWVNRRVDFVEDNIGGAPAEIWQNAAESLNLGRGDCEDYALAKLALLAALGFDREDLFLVIARDLVARSHHAVLAVRVNGRFVILDNATDELVEGDRVNDYRPIFSYSASGRWIHGFSQTPLQRPVQMAAAITPIVAP